MMVGALGYLDIVKYLVEQGADINLKNKNGHTALILTAKAGHLNTVQYLVEQGADIEIRNDDGLNAFEIAIVEKKWDVVKYFLEINTNEVQQKTMMDLALSFSAVHNSVDMFNYLLARGIDLGIKTRNNKSLLMIAAYNGSLETVRLSINGAGIPLNYQRVK